MRALALRRPDISIGFAIVGLSAVALWAAWIWLDGGFSPTVWGPTGLVLVGLLLVTGSQLGGLADLSEPRRLVALAGMVGLVGWSFLSIAWADFPSNAWAAADKTLLYGAGFALLACWPAEDGALTLIAAAFVGVVGLAAVIVAVEAAVDVAPLLDAGRLAAPLGYENASAALWMLAVWPACSLGVSRAAGPWGRGAAFAVTTMFGGLALLAESRAWLYVTPLVAIVFLLLSREPARLLAGLLVPAAAVGVAAPALVDVYDRASAGQPPTAATAIGVLACASLAAAVAGWGWGRLEGRVHVPRRLRRIAAVAAAALALAAVVAGVSVAAARVDHPGAWLADRWHSFQSGDVWLGGHSRFGSLSSDRYAEWRVAWHQFTGHPILGVGGDNFGAAYLLARTESLREPVFPHSLALRLLSQLGVVGAGLFALSTGAGMLAVRRRWLSSSPATANLLAAFLALFSYWLLHGLFDWLWEFPALSGPALGFLALGAAAPRARPGGGSGPLPLRAWWAIAPVAVAAAGAVALPWLAAVLEQGAGSWRSHPVRAYDRLELASDLDPLGASPLVLEGSIALERGDLTRARRALGSAVRREPRNWYAHFQLALAEGAGGRWAAAGSAIARARALNPRDPVAILAQSLIRRRQPIQPHVLNRLYLNDYRYRLRRS